MEGMHIESNLQKDSAWEQYEALIQAYITKKEKFKDDIARFRGDTIDYIRQVWDIPKIKSIQERWADLDKTLKDLRIIPEQIKKELNPNSQVYQGLLYSFRMLATSAMSLKQSHMQCVLKSVMDQLSDERREQIELSMQIGFCGIVSQEDNKEAVYAWEKYEKLIQASISRKQTFQSDLEQDSIYYTTGQTCDFLELEVIQRKWSKQWARLDQALEDINDITKQIKNELHPNSIVPQSMSYDVSICVESVASLKKSDMRFILDSVIHQLSGEQYQPNRHIELAKQTGMPDNVWKDEALNKTYKDAITQEWIQFPIGIANKQGIVEYYCARHLREKLKNTPTDQPYRLLDENEPLHLKNLHFIGPDNLYFKHLTNRLIFCLLSSVISQFRDKRFQPAQQIQCAQQAGLPDSAFQDPTLNKEYRDAITGRWIQFPIGVMYEGLLQYHCAKQLKKQLTTSTLEGQLYQLPQSSVPLKLQDFVCIQPNSTYFNRLLHHLDALKVHLAHTQQRKRNLMEIIKAAKVQFAYEGYQPIELIHNALNRGHITEEELKSPAFLPFLDQQTQQWIRFPVYRTIQFQGQEVCREYYCATRLEDDLKKCADTEPFALLEEFQNTTFQIESTRGLYLETLQRCLIKHTIRQPSLASMNSFFSPPNSGHSDSSFASRMANHQSYSHSAGPTSISSEQKEYDDPFIDIEITF